MNPVDEMDDLLRRAGARWRADQELPPEPDLEHIVHGKRKSWIPALAAAGVAVIAAATLAVLPNHNDPTPAAQPADSTTDPLLVKPGDKVRVSGQVIAVPGKTPVYCAPLAVAAIGYPKGKEPAPSCPAAYSVSLNGVDLDRIPDITTIKGVRTGHATLTGIWGDRAIDVTEQSAVTEPKPTPFPKLPCAAPAGGWQPKPSNVASPAVTAFLAAHADQAYGPVTYYPNGTSRNAPVVIMVGVAHGDLAAFREAFEKVYSGNLCVTPVLMSRADDERVNNELSTKVDAPKLGIYMTGGAGMTGGPATVSMLVYTQQVKDALTPIGLNLLAMDPQITPVR
ncbi:hypothetical protein [Kribbella sp. NPDC004536]|uniref:hypothetical protein n=1 Tax=Kribbella sp. NPDC004536 TaxID=3364106 RepID=UPI0036750380